MDKLNPLFERIADPYIAFDKHWNYSYVNTKAAALIGKSAQDLLGKNVWSEDTGLKAHQFYRNCLKSMKEQMSFHAEEYFASYRLWMHVAYYPSPEGLSILLYDITAQKKTDKDNGFKIDVLKAIGQAVVATDLNGRITYWNKAAEEIYGWTKEEAIGGNVIELLPSLISRDEAKEIMATLNRGNRWCGEFEVQRKDGSTFLAFVTNSPIQNNEGTLSGILGVSADISMFPKITNKLLAHEITYQKAMLRERLGHWEWDLTSNEFVLSDELYKIFHLDRSVLTVNQHTFFDFVHPKDKDWLREELEAVLLGEKKYDHFFRIVLNSGEVRYLHGMGVLLKDHTGKAMKLIGMTQDVTKQILIEQELSISEKNYRLLFQKNPIPLFMLGFPSLNFLEVNLSMITKYGYSREEFLKMNLRDLFADDNEISLDAFYNLATNDQSYESIVKHKKKSGEILHAKIYASTIVYNNKNVWLVAARNITKEIEFEAHLRENQTRLSIIFNNIVDALSLLKVEGPHSYRYEDVNETYTRLIRVGRSEVIGKLVGEILPSTNFEEVFESFDKAIKTGEIQKFLSEYNTHHDKKLFDLTAVPVKDENGDFSKLLVIGKDVTEWKKAEEALLQSNEQLRELSSHLQKIREDERTHIAREIHDELGQQLTGLKLDLAMLSKNLGGERIDIKNKIMEFLGIIDETINCVRRIASELRPSIFDHLGLVEAIDWQSKELTKRTGIPIEFTSDLNDTIPSEIGIGLFRIFQESFTNIARHAHATHVVCRLEKNDNSLHLIIIDNGIGFLQDKNKKTLGLLGMKERVSMMNGKYKIRSTPGKGTEVTVEIPYR